MLNAGDPVTMECQKPRSVKADGRVTPVGLADPQARRFLDSIRFEEVLRGDYQRIRASVG